MRVVTDDMRSLFEKVTQNLCSFVKIEMSTFDTLDDVPRPNDSYLFQLIAKLKELDESTVKVALSKNPEIFLRPEIQREANIRDGRIFTKRGSPKKSVDENVERRRRQSFAATNYSDVEIILTTEGVKEMTDLNMLFSMNAFFLPYCESKRQRSMYEHFFNTLVEEAQKLDGTKTSFMILQDSIMIIQSVSEAWMNNIELILNLIQLAYLRIKTHNGVMRSTASCSMLHEEQSSGNDTLVELTKLLQSETKIFKMIGTGKLLEVEGKKCDGLKLDINVEPWLDRLKGQIEALEMSHETDEITIETGLKTIAKYDKNVAFIANLRVFVETFSVFKSRLRSNNDVFSTFVKVVTTMFKSFDHDEKEMLTKYESPRKSPKQKMTPRLLRREEK